MVVVQEFILTLIDAPLQSCIAMKDNVKEKNTEYTIRCIATIQFYNLTGYNRRICMDQFLVLVRVEKKQAGAVKDLYVNGPML